MASPSASFAFSTTSSPTGLVPASSPPTIHATTTTTSPAALLMQQTAVSPTPMSTGACQSWTYRCYCGDKSREIAPTIVTGSPPPLPASPPPNLAELQVGTSGGSDLPRPSFCADFRRSLLTRIDAGPLTFPADTAVFDQHVSSHLHDFVDSFETETSTFVLLRCDLATAEATEAHSYDFLVDCQRVFALLPYFKEFVAQKFPASRFGPLVPGVGPAEGIAEMTALLLVEGALEQLSKANIKEIMDVANVPVKELRLFSFPYGPTVPEASAPTASSSNSTLVMIAVTLQSPKDCAAALMLAAHTFGSVSSYIGLGLMLPFEKPSPIAKALARSLAPASQLEAVMAAQPYFTTPMDFPAKPGPTPAVRQIYRPSPTGSPTLAAFPSQSQPLRTVVQQLLQMAHSSSPQPMPLPPPKPAPAGWTDAPLTRGYGSLPGSSPVMVPSSSSGFQRTLTPYVQPPPQPAAQPAFPSGARAKNRGGRGRASPVMVGFRPPSFQYHQHQQPTPAVPSKKGWRPAQTGYMTTQPSTTSPPPNAPVPAKKSPTTPTLGRATSGARSEGLTTESRSSSTGFEAELPRTAHPRSPSPPLSAMELKDLVHTTKSLSNKLRKQWEKKRREEPDNAEGIAEVKKLWNHAQNQYHRHKRRLEKTLSAAQDRGS